ncbi:MAG: 1,4-alpha-glucan branching protein GlgB [Magnetococcales bacterium]|nr:1,4-alpha-glucan branching protein GlgB [Magnetococcales bacterium]
MPRKPPFASGADIMDAIVRGSCRNVFDVLGMHATDDRHFRIQAFLPQADSVMVVNSATRQDAGRLTRVHAAGFFTGLFESATGPFPYHFRVSQRQWKWDCEDPYRFPPALGELDLARIAMGENWEIYQCLGAHPHRFEDIEGTLFAVLAPQASRVSVVGDFNDWDGRRNPMRLRHPHGVWELFMPGVVTGALYKFEIIGRYGEYFLKADPYARYSQKPPETASIVWHPEEFVWQDAEWLANRSRANAADAPMAIYEVHVGSWKRVPEENNRMLTYAELADGLIPYLKEMGFTHVELLPLGEHPYTGSWGYQPIGLFSPTSRFGTPDQLRAFVDRCHRENIGVILDWVPGHFPKDPHGLGNFDGSFLYEHSDPRKNWHQDWKTLIYNYGRAEVRNFLIANALYWIHHFHFDALRVDAVASMLRLDYSRRDGDWLPNEHGGNENIEAIEFIRKLNQTFDERGAGAVTIAEESTSWPRITHPLHEGGLGFRFKWNLGWMHDVLDYLSLDPFFRSHPDNHNRITFGLVYAFNENYILVLSHDEVVHLKKSLLGKMYGERMEKFSQLRLLYTFMYAHPGKKLLFMGGEFAQEREWNHDVSLDWHLLQDPMHRGVQRLLADLNHLYVATPPLFQQDRQAGGFEWIQSEDRERSVFAFLRHGRQSSGFIVVVCNFTPVPRHGYRIGVPRGGLYLERINSDAVDYGGGGMGNRGQVMAHPRPWNDWSHSIDLELPPLSALILEPAARKE